MRVVGRGCCYFGLLLLLLICGTVDVEVRGVDCGVDSVDVTYTSNACFDRGQLPAFVTGELFVPRCVSRSSFKLQAMEVQVNACKTCTEDHY